MERRHLGLNIQSVGNLVLSDDIHRAHDMWGLRAKIDDSWASGAFAT